VVREFPDWTLGNPRIVEAFRSEMSLSMILDGICPFF
jgi:hypothetical protein